MRREERTSIHLLLATTVSVFSVMLILITIAMPWELWMNPLITIGCVSVWCLHIGRSGSGAFYEYLCAGLMMAECFFFGVHEDCLYDIPAVICIMILIFSMLDKKRLLYMTAAVYVLVLLYHILHLHTISSDIGIWNMIRLGVGISVVAGALEIARHRINRRREDRKRYDAAFAQLEITGRQNAVFLSNVSHELRTPINMVLGISEVAMEKDLSPELRNDMHSIQLAGKRLSNQINNMLDYTEIVEGTLIPAREEYMITSVLNDVLTMTAMQISRNQLELVFDINPGIPSVLIGDAEKISHVLKILLENSIKFTEEGGVNVCIEYRQESYGVNLVIDIYDTGIGMTDSQLNQMFDDFYQADSGSSRFVGGLGLGIPIARGLLHAMGGFIHFDSDGQEGLHAHITIPQGVADDKPAIELSNADELCIACYFRPDKYSCDEVRRYYDKLILSLVEGLGIEGYQAHNFEGLLKLQRTYKLTHVFIAQAEYEENRSYYEELADTIRVVVIAERDFMLHRDSRLLVIHKPFSALSVVNLLNGEAKENGFEDAQAAGRRPFTCIGVRVLAVDDEEMNLVVAKGVLGSYGIQVDTCLSGREAVDRCSQDSYDIVFLDHMMPGFDGVETLQMIREIDNGAYQDLPVIALTANTISGAREMFRSEGFTEFIPKPIERSVLERVLRRVLPRDCIQYGPEPTIPDSPADGAAEAVSGDAERRQEAILSRETAGMEGISGAVNPEASSAGIFGTDAGGWETDVPGAAVREEAGQETDLPAGIASNSRIPEESGPAEETALPRVRLVQAGINVDMGLDYCCGEEEFYLEMLRMFSSQGEEKAAEIASLYDAENWKDYAVKVHALKSTSLTIGAEVLSGRAKELEQAGKKEDIEYIRKNHPALMQMYKEVCESMAGL
ncbi:response regulator [Lachnospiraceae bacterium 29-91]